MKRLLNIAFIFAMVAATLVSCNQEEIWVPNELDAQDNGSTISVNLNVSIPDPIKVESRAVEDAIESMRIFCFNEDNKLVSTSAPTEFTPVEQVEDGKSYTLNANVTYTTRYIHLVANQTFDVSEYSLGTTTEDDIFASLQGTTDKMIYWARVEIPEGTLVKDWEPATPIQMLRNMAKVTVDGGDYFDVEGFEVINTLMSGTVAPKHSGNGYPTNGSSTFSVTGETSSWKAADYIHMLGTEKRTAIEVREDSEIYIYESENPVENGPSIIIKGKNKGEETKWYRVTFTDKEGNQLTIRRNHHYTVKIMGNMLYGSDSFEAAKKAPSANNAYLYIDPEVTAVGNTDFSLTVDDTRYVRISAPGQTLDFGFSIGKSGTESIDPSKLTVKWKNDNQNVSSTGTLTPVKNNSTSTANNWRYDLSIALNELQNDQTQLVDTIVVKYGNKLQRMVEVKVIPALRFVTRGYYSKDPADAYKDPLASLDFFVPEDYPVEYPFTVLISTGDFTVKQASADQKNISILYPNDSGYGSDNDFGYKYAYQVTRWGEHSIALASHQGIVQDNGILTIESELFAPAEYAIPLSGMASKTWNDYFSLTVGQHDYVFFTAQDESLDINFEVEQLGNQAIQTEKIQVAWESATLTPVLTPEGDKKYKGTLTVPLEGGNEKPIRTLFVKYGDELQRAIKVILVTMQPTVGHVYYKNNDVINYNKALATLDFTIPKTYPSDVSFKVYISSDHFKLYEKGGNELSKEKFVNENDEEIYKYVYRVTEPGSYSIDLVSNGTATDNGVITLESSKFKETVIYTVPMNPGSEGDE